MPKVQLIYVYVWFGHIKVRLNGLRAFRFVYETGSVSEAAKRQNLSHSAVSRLLSSLEQQLEMKMFSRHGRRLTPTPEGTEFYAQTHRLLASIDDLPRVAKQIRNGRNLFVRVLAMRRVATEVALPVVAELHKELPGIEFQIDIIARRELEPALTSLDYDIAISTLPISDSVATIEPASVQELYAVVQGNDPLAGNEVVDIRQLLEREIVALPSSTRHRQEMDEIFSSFSASPRIAITVSSVEPAIELVARGVGITFADGIMHRTATELGCVFVPLFPARSVTYGIIRPPVRASHPEIDRLEEALRARFSELSNPALPKRGSRTTDASSR